MTQNKSNRNDYLFLYTAYQDILINITLNLSKSNPLCVQL